MTCLLSYWRHRWSYNTLRNANFQLAVTSDVSIGVAASAERVWLVFADRLLPPELWVWCNSQKWISAISGQAPIMKLTCGVCAHSLCECHEAQRGRGSEWRLPPTLTSPTLHFQTGLIQVQISHRDRPLLLLTGKFDHSYWSWVLRVFQIRHQFIPFLF